MVAVSKTPESLQDYSVRATTYGQAPLQLFQDVSISDPITVTNGILAGGEGTITIALHAPDGDPVGEIVDPAQDAYRPLTMTTDAASNTVIYTEESNVQVRSGASAAPTDILHRLIYLAPSTGVQPDYDITATVSLTGTEATPAPYPTLAVVSPTTAGLTDPITIHYDAPNANKPYPDQGSPSMPSITNTGNDHYGVDAGSTSMPFANYSINDPGFRTWDAMNYGGGTVTITLHAASGDLGTIQDTTTGPEGGYSAASSFDAASNTYTFTERAALDPTTPPITPDDILDRVVYTAPNATTDADVYATVSYTTQVVTGGGTYPTPTTQEPLTITSGAVLDLKVNAPDQPAPAPSPAPAPEPQPAPPVAAQPVPAPVIVNVTVNNFLFVNGASGQSGTLPGTAYNGPVAGLVNQLIQLGADNLAISAAVPNSFIHTGSGDDAIDVSAVSGNNVLDGGTGSNFLVGGAGQDTFFLDARDASASTWSTVGNFHSGDAATLWGLTPQGFAMSWADGQGAAGHEGLTLHATGNAGQPEASLTLAGYSTADLSNGRLAMVFGSNAGGNYLYVHGN